MNTLLYSRILAPKMALSGTLLTAISVLMLIWKPWADAGLTETMEAMPQHENILGVIELFFYALAWPMYEHGFVLSIFAVGVGLMAILVGVGLYGVGWSA